VVQSQHRTWYLDIASERVARGVILTPKGRISGVTAAKLAEAVSSARTDAPSVIIDLTGVDYISGPGIAVLQQAATDGTRMILCGLNDSVRITLELARVISDAVVKDTREAAIASLMANPEPRTATGD
jgi:anti-anti-sigma factor